MYTYHELISNYLSIYEIYNLSLVDKNYQPTFIRIYSKLTKKNKINFLINQEHMTGILYYINKYNGLWILDCFQKDFLLHVIIRKKNIKLLIIFSKNFISEEQYEQLYDIYNLCKSDNYWIQGYQLIELLVKNSYQITTCTETVDYHLQDTLNIYNDIENIKLLDDTNLKLQKFLNMNTHSWKLEEATNDTIIEFCKKIIFYKELRLEIIKFLESLDLNPEHKYIFNIEFLQQNQPKYYSNDKVIYTSYCPEFPNYKVIDYIAKFYTQDKQLSHNVMYHGPYILSKHHNKDINVYNINAEYHTDYNYLCTKYGRQIVNLYIELLLINGNVAKINKNMLHIVNTKIYDINKNIYLLYSCNVFLLSLYLSNRILFKLTSHLLVKIDYFCRSYPSVTYSNDEHHMFNPSVNEELNTIFTNLCIYLPFVTDNLMIKHIKKYKHIIANLPKTYKYINYF